jgi:L-malate glycosyltransferase
MKIAFLAKRHSIHTVRWVNALAERGHEIHLLSSIHSGEPLHRTVHFHPLPIAPPLGFFLNVSSLKRRLSEIGPDLLHTHFASGYGTLARLSGFHPNVLSVWGSDVFDFPNKSPLHRLLIRNNLKHADWVCSTSHVMAKCTHELYPVEHLSVIPFGIDTDLFSPCHQLKSSTLTVGTVKTLAHKYGIDLLIKAFAKVHSLLKEEQPELASRLRLLIAGGGPDENSLKELAEAVGVADITTFAGQVPHAEVPKYLNKLDIYVALSRLESFGVAVLEASACAIPVVVADVGGLPEVVKNNKTGFIVPAENVNTAATAISQLVCDRDLRSAMGFEGRQHVTSTFDWGKSIIALEKVYENVLHIHRF